MSLNTLAIPAILISAPYAGAAVLLGDQMAALLGDDLFLWVTLLLTVINMGMLIYAFLRGSTLRISMILLTIVQLTVFCQLHRQLYDVPGTSHPLSDWMTFTAVCALKAADLPDAVETYDILRKIHHQGLQARLAILGMGMMVGMLALAVIFKIIHRISETRVLSGMMTWIGLAGLPIGLGIIVLSGFRCGWGMSSWFLWPIDNILRAADFLDAIQIFGWQIHTPEPGMNAPVAAICFRVLVGAYLLAPAYLLYSRLLESRRTLEELVAVCTSPEHSTKDRVDAIEELEQFGSFAIEAVPDLIKVVVSSRGLRNAALSALREIDDQWSQSDSARDAVPKLMGLLKSDDIGTRIEAAEVLGEFGPAAESAVPDLVKVFTDSDVLRAAAQTMGRIGSVAIPDLVRILVNEDEHVRHAAVGALEKIDSNWQETEGAYQQITQFVKDLDQTDEEARTSAVRALGEIGPAAAPHLARLLADTDVRSLAIKALGEMGQLAEEAAVPHLINALGNQNKEVRTLASQALGKISPEWRQSDSAMNAIPYFMDALRQGTAAPDECGAAAEALVDIGPGTIQPLVEALVEGNKDVFNTAAQALKRIDPRWPLNEGAVRSVPRVAKGLQSNQWFVRRAAAEILGKVGPAAREAVPHLVKALADSNKKSRDAIKAALDKVLLKNSPYAPEEEEAVTPEARSEVARLMSMLTNGTGEARTKAAESLGEIGPAAEEAIPNLMRALADNDGKLRNEAAQSLGRIDPNWQAHESTLTTIPLFVKAMAGADVGFPCGMPGDALTEIGPPVVRHLVEALVDPNKDVVNVANQLLKKMEPHWAASKGACEAVPRVAEALGDSQWFVRRSAAQIIGNIGPAAIKAVPYLVKGLADKNKEVRNVCKTALDKVTVRREAWDVRRET